MGVFCTDAGHGGNKPGAVVGDVREKDLNLPYALALNEELKRRGHQVLTTRKSDVNVPSLSARCDLVNTHHRQKDPAFDAIISIHCNMAASRDPETGVMHIHEQSRGFYAIHHAGSVRGELLAKTIAGACRNADILLNHDGTLTTNELQRALAWIHRTLPVANLLEMGFMSNPDDLRLLLDEAYKKKMVTAIADGIDDYLKKIETGA